MSALLSREACVTPSVTRESERPLDSDTECQRLLTRYGSQSSAYFNLQSGVKRFGSGDDGFIAYYTINCLAGCFNFVFANPVCDPSRRRWLIKEFIRQVPGRHMFVGIDRPVADDLRHLGLKVNEFGTEFKVPVKDFSVAGKDKKQLRHASNLGKREGVVVREQSWSEVSAARVNEISLSWRSNKAVGSHELRLLTRPPVLGDEWGVRKFFAYRGDRMLGYVFFDPYYRDGKVLGYTANILRQDTDESPTGLLDYVILTAMSKFREEGVDELSLGIAPLYSIQPIHGDRPLLRRIAQGLFEHGNRFYAFKALSYHKSRYRGIETKWYMATDSSSAFSVAWSILKGTGVVSIPAIPLSRGWRQSPGSA